MESLITIANLIQRIYGRWFFQRIIASFIAIAGLTIISSIMISALLIGSFYGVYDALQYYGYDTNRSVIITGALFLVTTGVLVAITMGALRRLRHLPRKILESSPVTNRATHVVDSFMEGFLGEKMRSKV